MPSVNMHTLMLSECASTSIKRHLELLSTGQTYCHPSEHCHICAGMTVSVMSVTKKMIEEANKSAKAGEEGEEIRSDPDAECYTSLQQNVYDCLLLRLRSNVFALPGSNVQLQAGGLRLK